LQNTYQAFTSRGAEIVALAVAPLTSVEGAQSAAQAQFPMLSDQEHEIADAYGVYNLLGDGYAAPATFVIDRNGQITWSYVGQDAADRPTPQEIVEHLP
jgi:peroxiredoxin